MQKMHNFTFLDEVSKKKKKALPNVYVFSGPS